MYNEDIHKNSVSYRQIVHFACIREDTWDRL